MGWNPEEWACALAGEVGEACNLIKKLRRGEDVPMEAIGEELADVLAYLDLLAARLGIDLQHAYVAKFNAVSDRVGSDVKLSGVCRVCGCTDLNVCQPYSCSWMEPDLCCECVERAENDRGR